jgi:hypothetical protein
METIKINSMETIKINSMDTIKINKSKEITLDKWFESSIFHPDNLRYQANYVPEYLGIIKRLDALCWRMEIQEINIASSILDAIKIKFFPQWLLSKYPAKIKKIDISILWPQVNKDVGKITLDDFNKSQRFLSTTVKTEITGIK